MRPTFVYFNGNSSALDRTTSHHVATVLRKSTGDVVTGFDGQGQVYQLEITSIQKRSVEVTLLSQIQIEPPSQRLTLILSAYKPQRLEFALEKCTELGVNEFVITETEFSSTSLSHLQQKSSRFETIIRQACLQSEQPWFPRITFRSFDDILAQKYSDAWIGVTQELSNESLKPFSPSNSPVILVGPEGGFSEYEVTRVCEAGFESTHPFGSTLRSETAAIAFTALVQHTST
jgi:16S rRNA (uracil1498-N3)-methyltransferase